MFDILATGERMKFLRSTRHQSQREASLAMNWTAASWRDLEAGQKMMKVEDALLIADEYQVPVEWLINGETERLAPEWKTKIDKRIFEMNERLANRSGLEGSLPSDKT